jgi:hypothetical protein
MGRSIHQNNAETFRKRRKGRVMTIEGRIYLLKGLGADDMGSGDGVSLSDCLCLR